MVAKQSIVFEFCKKKLKSDDSLVK